MANVPNNTAGIAAGIVVLASSALAWVARMTVKRIDKLEGNVVTRKELNDLMNARAQADEERGRDINRLEAKMDSYHRDVTARIDTLIARRDRGR